MSFLDLKVSEYLTKVGSKTSTPGGGSVLGLVLSLACNLDLMVCNFTLNKKGYEEVTSEIEELMNKINQIDVVAKQLMDEDSICFSKLMDAYKSKDEEKISNASIDAAMVPYKLYKETKKLEEISSRLCLIGNKNVVSDAETAHDLCLSIYNGCKLNIKANIKSIKNQDILDKLNTIL
jgi:methenyltetrahydrofolate cyclohydrolase